MLKKIIFLSIFIYISSFTIKAFEATNTNNRSSHARPQVPILNLARVQRNGQQRAHTKIKITVLTILDTMNDIFRTAAYTPEKYPYSIYNNTSE